MYPGSLGMKSSNGHEVVFSAVVTTNSKGYKNAKRFPYPWSSPCASETSAQEPDVGG